jgi:hypothetical protein
MKTYHISAIIGICFLLVAPSLSFAAWTSSQTEKKEDLNSLCSAEDKYNITEDGFSEARIFNNQGATITLCTATPIKNNYAAEEYLLKYQLSPNEQRQVLAMEAEVMSWGLHFNPKGDDFQINFYWPAERPNRKVRELGISCSGACTLIEKCEIEHIASDVSRDTLFKQVEKNSASRKLREAFVSGVSKKNTLLLDQLFMEALTDDKRAAELLHKLEAGEDAAWAETLSSYEDFISDLSSKNCHWK